jgi:glycosyltransferase involved in cell wall biosynthesis
MVELKNNPFFSIIIPTYNHAHLINRCLDSVIAQTFNNWEAIVINNFSTDNTIEVVGGYKDPRIKLINFYNNGIIAASRNVGIKNAQSEWICFLDSDDWWYPEKLKICQLYTDYFNFIYHALDSYSVEGKSKRSRFKGRKLHGDYFCDLMINGNGISNSSVVVKKELLNKVGEMSEDRELVAAEDYDCWIRIAQIDNRFKYIRKFLGAYWVGNNISKASEKIILVEQFMTMKYIGRLNDDDKIQTLCNLSYRLGRFYQMLYDNEKAFYCFKKSSHSKSLAIKLKSALLIFYYRMKLLNKVLKS